MSGATSMVLGRIVDPPDNLVVQLLMTDSLACVVRANHPLIDKRISRKQYEQLKHVNMLPPGRLRAGLFQALERQRLRREVAVSVNHAMRHLDIPSVSVPMGLMSDTGMPVNLTLIGPAYSDAALLRYAYAYEQATHNRRPPSRVPALEDEVVEYDARATTPPQRRRETVPPELHIEPTVSADAAMMKISGTARDASGVASVRIYVNGHKVTTQVAERWNAAVSLAQLDQWRDPGATQVAVLVLAKDKLGNTAAELKELAAPKRAD